MLIEGKCVNSMESFVTLQAMEISKDRIQSLSRAYAVTLYILWGFQCEEAIGCTAAKSVAMNGYSPLVGANLR